MGRLTLRADELTIALADPDVVASMSIHAGVSHVVVEVMSPPDDEIASSLPGFGLACPVIAVTTPDLVDSCAFADVVLVGDGVDGPGSLGAVSNTIDASPIASASYALLLRDQDRRTTGTGSTMDSRVLAGLVAESSCYSMLQAGPEFAAWRASRPRRAPERSSHRVSVTRVDDQLNVVLDRPKRRNALDSRMRDQLFEALSLATVDADLKVSLSASGSAFSAGGDLDEFGERPDPSGAHVTRLARSVPWLAYRLRARMTALVHGACIGSGIEIPAFAGSVHAAEDAVFGLPEISLGLIPGAGGTISVTRRVGRRKTAFLGLSGVRINADTALRWGLVDAIQPG